ncbi:peptidoglycan editing factor PgeF [Pelagibacterales bacterium SAG-MED29]|nr:peptidoglycan editing factor PgeF [Pelagibacterales bacterium SAG-MED29]
MMFYSKKFKKFPNIKHCFFSRRGGFSKGIYRSLNCGKGSKDNKKNVNRNLSFVSKKLKIHQKKLYLMYQTHSNKVVIINKKNQNSKRFNSDALITKLRGVALGVVTADCVPIILYDTKNQIIACIHAGWKGASSGIIENTVKKFKKFNSKNKIFASVGPCIGLKSYEVDLNFYKMFVTKSKNNTTYFLKKNKLKKLFNLRKYVNDKLVKLKVKVDHVNHDTFKERSRFFSYRRSQKLGDNDYGRSISVISLTNFSQN